MDRAVSARVGDVGAVLALLTLSSFSVFAQSISDPTQPPAALMATSGSASTIVAAPAAPELQSVLISHNPGGRKVAVINGATVRIGERFGDAVVVGITQTTVVLRRGKVSETLKLFPPAQADRVSTPHR